MPINVDDIITAVQSVGQFEKLKFLKSADLFNRCGKLLSLSYVIW